MIISDVIKPKNLEGKTGQQNMGPGRNLNKQWTKQKTMKNPQTCSYSFVKFRKRRFFGND